MHILQINKFYHIVGGVDRYFFEVSELLEEKGHKLAYFSMEDKNNKPSKWSKYFISNLSFERVNLKNGLRVIGRMVYSVEARRRIAQLLDVFHPDIAHIHNIYHQISPSILLELKKRKIPIVHTVGDYHLISPHHNNLFHNGKICEISKISRFYNTVIHRCVKNSYFASFAEALEQYIHQLFGFYTRTVDYFIAPSKFYAGLLKEYRIPEEKIIVLSYFVDCNKFKANYSSGDYVLYFGRLYPEKGVMFLLNVMKQLPHIRFKIVGKGPEGNKLLNKVKSNKLKNVEIILRFIEDKELKSLVERSRFTVFPSQSYEAFGISLLESYANGKPVVASKIGALPEIVKVGKTGFLFKSGNINDCVQKINKLWNNPNLCREMGRNAREYVEKNFGPEEHYKKLMGIYEMAIGKHGRS